MICVRSQVVLILLNLLLVAPTTIFAQDTVDVFFDDVGTVNCLPLGAGQPHHAYLILKNPSASSGIAGWQGTLSLDSTMYMASPVFSGQAINFGDSTNFLVGLGEPLPASSIVILAEFDLVTFSEGTATFGPLGTSGDAFPMFVSADGPGMIPMFPEFGGVGGVSVTIGLQDCPSSNLDGSPVAIARSSWSGLKAQYR